MRRDEIKSYDVMSGIMERDDCEELGDVGFEDRICFELEDSLNEWEEKGDPFNTEEFCYLIGSLMGNFYKAYPVECALSFISPSMDMGFQVAFDVNRLDIKEVNVRNVTPDEIREEDMKKYFVC